MKLRSALLNTFLFVYNGITFVILNITMWRNDMWNEKKWKKINPK